MSSDVRPAYFPNRADMRPRGLRPARWRRSAVPSMGLLTGVTVLTGILSVGAALGVVPAATAVAAQAATAVAAPAATAVTAAADSGARCVAKGPHEQVCTQTFTSSGEVRIYSLGELTVPRLTVSIAGGAGGKSADGTPGGKAQMLTFQYEPDPKNFPTLRFKVGGAGGDARGAAGGAGGAGGGGKGGSSVQTGAGGGGGGGATSLWKRGPALTSASTLLAVAGGGGGGANGGNVGGGDSTRTDGYGRRATDAGTFAMGAGPDFCGGGGAHAHGGGRPGCTTDSWRGQAGTAQAGGNGGTSAHAGGGGGGAGAFGGGGGGVDAHPLWTQKSAAGRAGGGGGGSSMSALSGTTTTSSGSGSVTLTWSRRVPDVSTSTSITSAASYITGQAVTLSARTTATESVPVGTMQFHVDGMPVGSAVTVSSSGVASTIVPAGRLSIGSHDVTAVFAGATGWTDSSARSTVTVTDGAWSFAKVGAADLQLLEVNNNAMHDGAVVDTWAQYLDGGRTQGNQLWRYRPEQDGSGWGQLVNVTTGKCLEVNGTDGKVDQWTCVSGAQNQHWRIVPAELRTGLQVRSSGEYLGTMAAGGAPVSSGNGTKVVMHPAMSDHTDWRLIKTTL